MPAYGTRVTDETRETIAELVRAVPLDFGGGSSLTKALVFADLIAAFGLRDAVEIGVYRGRSLLPIAAVLRDTGGGRVIGIDPWAADAALQRDDHEVGAVVNEWARAHPWEETYQEVLQRIDAFGLAAHCEILRTTSAEAAATIPDASVGLVHVDGNHDRDAVQRDVEQYLPKLQPGGFLALDDASWSSVRPILEELRGELEPVFHLHDALPLHDEQPTDFAVFRVPGEPPGAQDAAPPPRRSWLSRLRGGDGS
jgi:predicted O-methyltransferase YrrM